MYSVLKKKSLRGLSIGYRTMESQRRKADNVRLFTEVRLFEVSVVGMLANPLAAVETVKSQGDLVLKDVREALEALSRELEPEHFSQATAAERRFVAEAKRQGLFPSDCYDRAEAELEAVLARLSAWE